MILEIDNKPENFSCVWVHLQDIEVIKFMPYKIVVPHSCFYKVFDPYHTKKETESRKTFVRRDIEDLGTFILEGYIKTMASSLGEDKTYYKWVIATVDVIEENDCLKLIGKVVPFQPHEINAILLE